MKTCSCSVMLSTSRAATKMNEWSLHHSSSLVHVYQTFPAFQHVLR